MKRIIKGKVYNTETAQQVGHYESEYGCTDFNYYEQVLYRKKTGEYFLYGRGNAASPYAQSAGESSWTGGESIRPLTFEEAREWAESHLEADLYIEEFGDPGEGEGEDVRFTVLLSPGVHEKLRRLQAETGESMSTIAGQLIERHIDSYEPPMTVDKIIEDSNLSDKDKKFVQSLLDEGVLRVSDEDFPLFEHWIEHEQLDSYRPTFFGGYTPDQFQYEQIEQFGEEVDLEDRQWYTILPEGIVAYSDDPGWWK